MMRLMHWLTPAERIASDTWYRLKYAESLAVRMGEETLTDMLLLDLKSNEAIYGIHVFQTSKQDEAIYGTDYEILVRVDRTRAWRYAIQAKKLFPNGYRGIKKKTGNPKRLQLDVLEDHARRVNAIPCYILYNYVDSSPCSACCSTSRYWHCNLTCDEPQFGCTLVPSWIVRRATRNRPAGRGFDFLHKYPGALPWRCLFDCPYVHCGRAPGELHESFRQEAPTYDWVPTEPVAEAWPEHLLNEERDSDADFIERYFEWQERDFEFRPRRLLLFDPELYARSDLEARGG